VKLLVGRKVMKVMIVAVLATLMLAGGCVAAYSKYDVARPSAAEWESVRDDFNAVGVLDFSKTKKLLDDIDTPRDDGEGHKERLSRAKDVLEEMRFATQGAGGGEPAAAKRMIIYTAGYVVSVYDLEDSSKKIVKLAEDAGGYVATQTNDTVVVRVPAGKFREVVEKLEAVGRVVDKKLQALDVTEQHTDLSLRLAAKKKYLETLQNLLDKAQDAKAMLEIQKEIGEVVEEIEAMEGKLRYLSDQVSYSTITVRLHLATKQAFRTFRLPFGWIESLGIEHLVRGGAR